MIEAADEKSARNGPDKTALFEAKAKDMEKEKTVCVCVCVWAKANCL